MYSYYKQLITVYNKNIQVISINKYYDNVKDYLDTVKKLYPFSKQIKKEENDVNK